MDFQPIGRIAADTIVLHVDSRYRDKSRFPNSGCFSIPLNITNVTSIRLSSIELPNVFYTFTTARNNCSFMINNTIVTIPQGNYTAEAMICAVQTQLDGMFGAGKYSIAFSSVDGKVTISNGQFMRFVLKDPPLKTGIEKCAPSLLYSLGFRKPSYSGQTNYVSESIIDVVGPNYLIMKVNDFGSMRYREYGVSNAFAKIILNGPKCTVTFDSGANFVSKQHDFHQPVNLNRLNIDIVDPYDQTLDMLYMDYSLTFEVISIRDSYVKHRLEQDRFQKQHDAS